MLKFIEKFGKVNKSLSSGVEWIAVIALLLMMVVTTVDVIGAKAAHTPVPGSVDITVMTNVML